MSICKKIALNEFRLTSIGNWSGEPLVNLHAKTLRSTKQKQIGNRSGASRGQFTSGNLNGFLSKSIGNWFGEFLITFHMKSVRNSPIIELTIQLLNDFNE